jgi:hypothetical protein
MNEYNKIRLKNTMQGKVQTNKWILPPPLTSLHRAAISYMDLQTQHCDDDVFTVLYKINYHRTHATSQTAHKSVPMCTGKRII